MITYKLYISLNKLSFEISIFKINVVFTCKKQQNYINAYIKEVKIQFHQFKNALWIQYKLPEQKNNLFQLKSGMVVFGTLNYYHGNGYTCNGGNSVNKQSKKIPLHLPIWVSSERKITALKELIFPFGVDSFFFSKGLDEQASKHEVSKVICFFKAKIREKKIPWYTP